MPYLVTTAADDVSVPYQPSALSGLNSRTIVTSGTTVTLNDYEYAALSETAFSSGTLLDGGSVGNSGALGTVVTKAGYTPTAATVDLFTVSGLVRITELFGVVTTAMDATATTVKIVFDATVTAAVADISAAVTVTSDVLGQLYGVVGPAATAIAESAGVFLPPASHMTPGGQILPAGKIQATGSAVNAGIITWYVAYQPIESDATIVAAA